MPQISVIIPLYNKEQYIEATIRSVLSQDYKDYEIVIIDDGSTDKSCQVVNSIKDDRIRLISQENHGVSASRNNGVMNSNGKYIFFLDADDALIDHALSNLYNSAVNNQDADIIVSGFNYRNNDGEIVKIFENKDLGYLADPFKSLWMKNVFFRTGNILIKRSFLLGDPLFNVRLTLFEDFDCLYRLLRKAKVYSNNSIVLDYNRYEGGLSRKYVSFNKDFASVINPKDCKNKYEYRLISSFLIRRFVVYFKNKDYATCWKLLRKIVPCIFHSF